MTLEHVPHGFSEVPSGPLIFTAPLPGLSPFCLTLVSSLVLPGVTSLITVSSQVLTSHLLREEQNLVEPWWVYNHFKHNT